MKINDEIKQIIERSIKEDVGDGDITTENFIRASDKYKAIIFAKSNCIVCGVGIAAYIFKYLNKNCKIRFFKKDGDLVNKNQKIMQIIGGREVLTAERTALNFMQHLSGIATMVWKFVKIAKKYNIKIYDTRKTIPTLRSIQKYAVRIGGGFNHRFGLYDHFMIKDNHLSALGNDYDLIYKKIKEIKNKYKNKKIEIEVQNLNDLENVVKLKPDIIMLDNMKVSDIKIAISIIRNFSKNIEIEISGGVNLGNIKKYLIQGVNRISIGSLTHSVKAQDISMNIEKIYKESL